jgi:hypothetical protein
MDTLYSAIGFAIAFAARNWVWWLLLSTSLWLGRKFLPQKLGSLIFGHYWVKKHSLRKRGG